MEILFDPLRPAPSNQQLRDTIEADQASTLPAVVRVAPLNRSRTQDQIADLSGK
jgi:hypothetical protein